MSGIAAAFGEMRANARTGAGGAAVVLALATALADAASKPIGIFGSTSSPVLNN